MIIYALPYMIMLALAAAGSNSNYIQRPNYYNSTTRNGFQMRFKVPQQLIYGKRFVRSITKYPYMAFITFNPDLLYKDYCGSTILSPKYVLTAAHCLRQCDRNNNTGKVVCIDRNSKMFTIYLGSSIPKHAISKVKVRRYFVHPKYQRFDDVNKCEGNYDIAIVELEKPIKFNKRISKVKLPKSINKKHRMKNCINVGWGRTEDEEKEGGNVGPFLDRKLKHVSSHIIGIRKCIHHLKISDTNYTIYPDTVCRATTICTKEPKNKRGICNGDSGGPLICNGVQVGIVSMGATSGCAGPHRPLMYTRVDINRKWIKNTIAKFAGNIRMNTTRNK